MDPQQAGESLDTFWRSERQLPARGRRRLPLGREPGRAAPPDSRRARPRALRPDGPGQLRVRGLFGQFHRRGQLDPGVAAAVDLSQCQMNAAPRPAAPGPTSTWAAPGPCRSRRRPAPSSSVSRRRPGAGDRREALHRHRRRRPLLSEACRSWPRTSSARRLMPTRGVPYSQMRVRSVFVADASRKASSSATFDQRMRYVRGKSNRRRPRAPPRHRRDACSMAWRCRFSHRSTGQRGHVIAEKMTRMIDFHTGRDQAP